jgi:hypothetical protein
LKQERKNMGEAKRRKEQLGSEYGRGLPPILAEAVQEISDLIEITDHTVRFASEESERKRDATLATAGEKMAAAIVDFGHGAINAVDERIAWHVCWDGSDEPFWKALIDGFVARQPACRPDETEDDYDDRVATALENVVKRLQDLVRGFNGSDPKMVAATPSPIKFRDRVIERWVMCFTPEGNERIMREFPRWLAEHPDKH